MKKLLVLGKVRSVFACELDVDGGDAGEKIQGISLVFDLVRAGKSQRVEIVTTSEYAALLLGRLSQVRSLRCPSPVVVCGGVVRSG